jgi:hypothetical protein
MGDRRALSSFYLEFGRRLEVLKLIEGCCRSGPRVLSLGAQPRDSVRTEEDGLRGCGVWNPVVVSNAVPEEV